MLKHLVYILWLISLGAHASQKKVIDSLHRRIPYSKGTTLADVYNQLAWEYRNSAISKTDSLAKLAVEISKNANYERGIGQAYNNLALVQRQNGEYRVALDRAQWALLHLVKAHDLQGYSSVYNTIASIHHLQGRFSVALYYYLLSLEISESLRDKTGMARTLNNIGVIYLDRENYTKSLTYFLKAYNILKDLNDENGIADELNNIGSVYKETNDNAKAISCYQRSVEINEKNNDLKSVVAGYINIGSVYVDWGDNKKALENYFRALSYNEKVGDLESEILCKNNLSELYLKMDMMHISIKYATDALHQSLNHHLMSEITFSYKLLFQSYVKMKDFKEALHYHELFTAYSDSLSNEATARNISFLEAQFEHARHENDSILKVKEQEMASKIAAEKEKRITEYIFIIGLILALFIILIYVVFFILKWQKQAT